MVMRQRGPSPYEVMRNLQSAVREPSSVPASPLTPAPRRRHESLRDHDDAPAETPQAPEQAEKPPRTAARRREPADETPRPELAVVEQRAVTGDDAEVAAVEDPQGWADVWDRWVGRARAPIVLRVPRAVAALAVAAVLVVVTLAYWAGSSRGYRSAVAMIESGAVLPSPDDVPVDGLDPETAAIIPDSGATAAPGEPSASPADALEAGRNYFVLAHFPAEYAQNLVRFLARHQVRAVAIRPDGQRLFQVLAARGFSKDELGTAEEQRYEVKLKQLGRLWKEQTRSSSNLDGMYLDRYDGEAIAEMIR